MSIFIPGHPPTTNELLAMLKKESAYRERMRRWSGIDAQCFVYTNAVAEWRRRTMLEARNWLEKHPEGTEGKICACHVEMSRKNRVDPDAAALIGKAVVDGLQDAGVLDERKQVKKVVFRSDRGYLTEGIAVWLEGI
jgi:hypothetical protein